MKEGLDFWYDAKLSDEEKNRELVAACRRTFLTADGRIVLNMLLTDLYFFEQSTDSGGAALSNYAKFFIRERLGVRDTVALSDAVAGIAETAASGEGTYNG
jgi:hypothetical protein